MTDTKPRSLQDMVNENPELKRAMHHTKMAALLDTYSDEMRPQVVYAARKSLELLTEIFPELSTETRSQVAAAFSNVVFQIQNVPARYLSDTLEHTATAYLLAACHLDGSYTLDEEDEPKSEEDDEPAPLTGQCL